MFVEFTPIDARQNAIKKGNIYIATSFCERILIKFNLIGLLYLNELLSPKFCRYRIIVSYITFRTIVHVIKSIDIQNTI